MSISVIKKRDGRIVPFDVQRIANALRKSFEELDAAADWRALCDKLAWDVYTRLDQEDDPAPRVEHIQDTVFRILTEQGYEDAARRYLLFRQRRDKDRPDASDLRFGGEALYLFDELEDATSIDEAAFWAYVALRENHYPGQKVMDLCAALAPGARGTFARCYYAVLPWAFKAETGTALHRETLAACAKGAAKEGALDPAAAGPYDRREADLLCGTLGCDRKPVEEAQRQARAWAGSQAKARAEEVLKDLLTELDALDCTAADLADLPDPRPTAPAEVAACLAAHLFE